MIPPAPIRAFDDPDKREEFVRQVLIGIASGVVTFYVLHKLKVFK